MSDITFEKKKFEKALHESGLVNVYTKFREQKILARIKAGKEGFSGDYKELIDIRDAEEKFYFLMGEVDYDREDTKRAAKIRAKYKPALDAYFKEQYKFTYTIVDFARQIIGETPPPDKMRSFGEYADSFGERAESEGCYIKDAENFIYQVEQVLKEKLGKDRLLALNFNPENVPSLRPENLPRTLNDCQSSSSILRETTFEIFAASAHEKTPEDLNTLVSLWLDLKVEKPKKNPPAPTTSQTTNSKKTNETTAANNPSPTMEEEPTPSNTSWQKKLGYGALGTALMVAPSLLPKEKDDKLTFGKVIRTTVAVLAPIAGIILLGRLMQGGFSERVQNEARSQGNGLQ